MRARSISHNWNEIYLLLKGCTWLSGNLILYWGWLTLKKIQWKIKYICMCSVNLFVKEKHFKIYVYSQDTKRNLIPHSHRHYWKELLKRKVNLATYLTITATKSVLNQPVSWDFLIFQPFIKLVILNYFQKTCNSRIIWPILKYVLF